MKQDAQGDSLQMVEDGVAGRDSEEWTLKASGHRPPPPQLGPSLSSLLQGDAPGSWKESLSLEDGRGGPGVGRASQPSALGVPSPQGLTTPYPQLSLYLVPWVRGSR